MAGKLRDTMADQQKYETPAERRSRLLERQTLDTGSEPGPDLRPTLRPSSATSPQHPTTIPKGCKQDQMHSRIHELRSLVGLLEGEMLRLASADIIEPAVWSSVALMLREVATRSELLRRQALELAAAALESDHQTSGTLGLF